MAFERGISSILFFSFCATTTSKMLMACTGTSSMLATAPVGAVTATEAGAAAAGAERAAQKVLGFDPTSGQGEPVGKELNKNDIGQLLAVLGAGPFIFFPFLEDLVEARRRGLITDDLRVIARDLEGFGDEIGNVFPSRGSSEWD